MQFHLNRRSYEQKERLIAALTRNTEALHMATQAQQDLAKGLSDISAAITAAVTALGNARSNNDSVAEEAAFNQLETLATNLNNAVTPPAAPTPTPAA